MRAIVVCWPLVLALALGGWPRPLTGQEAAVRAVLFYSPACSHCATVIRDVLPTTFARFGGEPQLFQGRAGHIISNGQLELLLVDASQLEGQVLYQASTRALAVSPERMGVPRLVCGDSVLVGSLEIPDRFPALIAAGMIGGGVPWPAIDGLAAVFPEEYGLRPLADSARAPPDVAAEVTWVPPALDGPVIGRMFRTDPVGGSLALVVLAAMVLSIVLAMTGRGARIPERWEGSVPALVVVGMGVAGYLAYVESTGALAVCGPVGDCNAVQQSRYAHLWGVPIAGIGLAGYAAILTAWIVARVGPGAARPWASRAAFVFALVGTIASAVLTLVEPFVIGAVCSWCLTSAAVMTLLLWLLGRPAAAGAGAVRRPPS